MTEKIKISAAICEFDPLHFGHAHLLRRMKEYHHAAVCVMSGNFVQRGGPALLDKWTRARLALGQGADLVVELPLPWAAAGAQRFALGGVLLASALPFAGALFFGCETPELSRLKKLAQALASPEFSQALAWEKAQAKGFSFAKLRELALASLLGPEEASLLRQPNNILAVEYIAALEKTRSPLNPTPILRVGAGHGQQAKCGEFCSASQLRERVLQGASLSGLVPPETEAAVQAGLALGSIPASFSHLERAVLCRLRAMKPEDFALLPDISEGLDKKLFAASRRAGSLEELYCLVKSKRYSHARVRRMVLAAFLGLTVPLPEAPPYLRILAMSPVGKKLLEQPEKPLLPVAIRASQFGGLGEAAQALYQLETRADDLYALAQPVPPPCGRDQWEPLIRL